MNIAHIRSYLGMSVVVQLRDAMALGKAGPGKWVPVCNEKGELLKLDGSVAPDGTKKEELLRRPAWPSMVRVDDANAAEFRFAIENAMVSVTGGYDEVDPARVTPELVHIHYTDDEAHYELVVEPEAIVGITCVRKGPRDPPPEPSSLIQPGSN